MVTWDEGGPVEETVGGVHIIKICRRDEGIKGIRYFYPRWTGLVRALRRADADVYYHNGGGGGTGQIALWCRKNHKCFVFSTASDADCDPAFPAVSKHEHWLYRLGLSEADRLIVQTQTQQSRLRTEFGLDSVIIPLPCLVPLVGQQVRGMPLSQRVLWVGRVCPVKRPDRLLDLAQACVDLSFDLVGPFCGPDGSIGEHARSIQDRAARIPNLQVHGPMNHGGLSQLYSNALCLCCTSEYEGFPNTFVEAWSHGLPVISTLDPDGVIALHNLGIVARDIREIQAAIRSLLDAPARYQEISGNARRYFLDNHQADSVLPRFESLFLETIACQNA
jgi:glycosyltransferase involved in cell wall biosynthesis